MIYISIALLVGLFGGCKRPALEQGAEIDAWRSSEGTRLVATQATKLKQRPASNSDNQLFCQIPLGTELAVLGFDDELTAGKHALVHFHTTYPLSSCDWAATNTTSDQAISQQAVSQQSIPAQVEETYESTPNNEGSPSPDGIVPIEVIEDFNSTFVDTNTPDTPQQTWEYRGYLWMDHFRPVSGTPSLRFQQADLPNSFDGRKVDTDLGRRLANYVAANKVGFTGRCWTYVQRAINAIVLRIAIRSISLPGNAIHNVTRLASDGRFRMCRAKITNPLKLPVGSVLVYAPGRCGAHRLYGHGEIRVSGNLFCSDGCRRLSGSCTPTAAFFPCKK